MSTGQSPSNPLLAPEPNPLGAELHGVLSSGKTEGTKPAITALNAVWKNDSPNPALARARHPVAADEPP